jgi:hypothetical protein
MMASFSQFRFGFASAEQESTNAPDLLLDGFLDASKTITEIRNGSKFLVLGYKGSGKSAIGEHLRLLSASDPHLFVTSTFLSDFPYSAFKKIVKGDIEPEAKYPTAWSWLLLLYFFDSFSKDNGAYASRNIQLMIESLRAMGLLPAPSLNQSVLISSKRSFKISLPPVLETQREQAFSEERLSLPFFVERLKEIASEFKSSSKHLLIIDGLDDILTKRDVQYDSLAALLLESHRLNIIFARTDTPAKVIVLCRADLFERLPGANKNKLRQDSSIFLDWYHDTRNPDSSMLLKLANLRARISNPSVSDVINDFLPATMQDHPTKSYLLDLTRHTPRDFLQLLTHIQKVSRSREITRTEILSGIRNYSCNYFIPEIKDELVAYLDPEEIDCILAHIASLRKREFSFNELCEAAESGVGLKQLDLPRAVAILFECSAIGTVHNRPTGSAYFTFKYRNRQSLLNLSERLLLHRGMWKAMNLI